MLYAYDSSAPHHDSCRHWFESALNAPEALALPWQTLRALVRIATNPHAVREPLSGAVACSIVATWLERANVVLPDPGERFWEIFQSQVQLAELSGPLLTDAALASRALELGATLC